MPTSEATTAGPRRKRAAATTTASRYSMAASIGEHGDAGAADRPGRGASGTTTMATALTYSLGGEPRRAARRGAGRSSSSSTPVIASTSMPPLPRTSASSSEPWSSSRQRGASVLPTMMRVTLWAPRVREDLVGGALAAQRDRLGRRAARRARMRPKDVLALRRRSGAGRAGSRRAPRTTRREARAAMRRAARTSRTALGLGPMHTSSRSPVAQVSRMPCSAM